MNSNIIIAIAVIISVISTAGIMYSLGFDGQAQTTQMPETLEPETTQVPETIQSQHTQIQPVETVPIQMTDHQYFEGTNNIKKIASQKDLENIIVKSSSFGNSYGSPMFSPSSMMREGGTFLGSPFAAASSGTDYSTTNVQEENVDEPDYLKNDSKYVYIVSRNTLSIIDVYPAESANLVIKIALDLELQYIHNMFLNGDRLVIFYNADSDKEIIRQYEFEPIRSYSPITHALIIDVSDKENPTIVKDYSIDGHFSDARMIGNYAYFVTNSNVNDDNPTLPEITEGSAKILVPDAYYFDNVEQFSNFNTLTAMDIFGDTINSETFLMGYTGTFYVSEDNFYITYQQNTPFRFYEDSSQDRFIEVILPLLPRDLQERIKAIQDDSEINAAVQWSKISALMQESYNNMNKEVKESLFEKIRKTLNEYDVKMQEDARKTIIHKIAIDRDQIEYVGKGEIPGRLLNQFSLDEKDTKLRVATTTEYYIQHQGTVRANAVYVLDEKLNIVGELEEIAPNESIYSARFMGDRLYLVTFEQIDPFFVIDLSKDTPKILGELKIPGFSNYLHPYDEDHIIGVGRDTKASDGRVKQLGIKIALFNVSDVNNPKVVDDVIIGNGATYSDAQNDHKAFFFDKKSGILSIPINEDVNGSENISRSDTINPNYKRWSGFYIFDLDATGFIQKGTITHQETSDEYYGLGSARTFYIDEVLYTASENGYLKMNSLDTLKEINSLQLGSTGGFIDYIGEEDMPASP